MFRFAQHDNAFCRFALNGREIVHDSLAPAAGLLSMRNFPPAKSA